MAVMKVRWKAAAVAAALVLILTSVALAVSPGSASRDKAGEGFATLSSAVTPLDVVDAGGGKWNYGTEITFHVPPKHVWSYYLHNELWHRSTAIIGSDIDTAPCTPPTAWSYADAYGWPNQTGYAYWSTSACQ